MAQARASAWPDWQTSAAMLFSALSALAGWQLLRRRRGALVLSAAVQAMQVVWVWGPSAAYRVTSGLALIGSYNTGRGLDAIIGATAAFRLGLPEPGAGVGAGINLFSAVAVIALAKLHRVGELPLEVRDDGSGGTAGARVDRSDSSPGA